MPHQRKKKNSEVFGIARSVRPESYIDRGALDDALRRQLERETHVALRGESKCGKSWLRQNVLPDAITVQCRLHKSVVDIYKDALSSLGVKLELEETAERKVTGRVEAQGDLGVKLFAKLGVTAAIGAEAAGSAKRAPIGHDVTDLRFIADLILVSGKRLVIEDFHYLSVAERKKFAFDLKALWDYGLFVLVVGVWSESNMLLYLNPDLSGRVHELSIFWRDEDLKQVLDKGGRALRIESSGAFKAAAADNCYGNVGLLQSLTLKSLDLLEFYEEQEALTVIDDTNVLESAAMEYAEELNPLYQQFARRVSSGIRSRQDSTGIYAHAMAVIMEADDQSLIRGLRIENIFRTARGREPRIQKGNLRVVLEKIESLQVDEDGRGLVVAYNEATGEVSVVDRQLLLYRKYRTVQWPWEDLVAEAGGVPKPAS